MSATRPNLIPERLILLWRRTVTTAENLMDWSSAWVQGTVFLLVAAVLGGLIGWFTSAYFARLSAKDTEAQLALTRQQLQVAEHQSRMLVTLLTVAEEGGKMKLARDGKGEITGGRIIELAADATSTSRASADLTTGPKPP